MHFKAVELRGDSMAPTFNEGDWLLFIGLRANLESLVGKVVLIRRRSGAGSDFLAIKRAIRIDGASVWVEGDNKESSTDSRSWGAIPSSEVIGKLLLRYHKRNKRGEKT
jgi:phage repressor protein C with HTH and peptisase S24 domain